MFFLFKSCLDIVTSIFAVIVLCINSMKYAFCSPVADQNQCLFLLSHGVFLQLIINFYNIIIDMIINNYKLFNNYKIPLILGFI